MSTRVWPRRLLTAFYWFVAFTFFVGFVTKYWPGPTFFGPAYSVKFVEWGYPSWFRFVVGTIEGCAPCCWSFPAGDSSSSARRP
ncbi:hypothetical protein ACFQYP_17915 [Nonomuraea antimicrobica]